MFGLDLSIDAMDVSGEQQVCVCWGRGGGQSKAFFILYICFSYVRLSILMPAYHLCSQLDVAQNIVKQRLNQDGNVVEGTEVAAGTLYTTIPTLLHHHSFLQ